MLSMKSSQQLWNDIQKKKEEYGDKWLTAWLLAIHTDTPKIKYAMKNDKPF